MTAVSTPRHGSARADGCRIAVCIARYGIDYSPSIVNLVQALSEVAEVDLYLREVHHVRSPVLSEAGVRVIRLRRSLNLRLAARGAIRLARTLAKAVVTGGASLPRRFDRWRTVDVARREAPSYDRVVAVDPHGLILCKELFPDSRPVYYSLELLLEEDARPSAGGDREQRDEIADLLARERPLARDMSGLIIQSDERCQLFLADYPVSPDLPVFILPVTYRSPPQPDRLRAIHRRHGLADDARIAIHLGGINHWFGSIEVARSVAQLGRWHLYLQGNHDARYLRALRGEIATGRIRHTIVSRRFYDRIEDLDPLLASSDVGIAWYRDLSANMRTAGRSSGKIAAYLRFGLPVVASDSASTREAIQETGCGVCVGEPDEVGDGIAAIEGDLESYRARALDEYRARYWFERYRRPLQRFVLPDVPGAGP